MKNNKGFEISRLFDKPWTASIVCNLIWFALSFTYFYIATNVLTGLMMFLIGYIFLYPAGYFITSYLYAKNYGIKWHFILGMVLVVVLEYFILDMRDSQPNVFVLVSITVFFGTAFGNLMSDKAKIIQRENKANEKKIKRDLAEKKYKSIIDDK